MQVEFVDTNILLYAHGINAKNFPEKVAAASEFLKEKWDEIFITWQALVEFAANLEKKSSLPLDEKLKLIRSYSSLLDREVPQDPIQVERALALVINLPAQVESAVALVDKEYISFWDANMVTAVAAHGGTILYSEDLRDGAVHEGVEIRNPFRRGWTG